MQIRKCVLNNNNNDNNKATLSVAIGISTEFDMRAPPCNTLI